MGNEIYRITDGTTVINLLHGIDVVYLNPDGGVRPVLPPWKSGGTWQSSPLSDGRRLVNRQFENLTDTHSIIAAADTQDQIITGLQELYRLLEKGVQYWVTDWQNDPVWLEARADCETNIRYAIISAWGMPDVDDPFKPPFTESPPSMQDLVLTLEHTPWMAYAPGSEPCVEISGEQLRYETDGSDTAAPAANSDDGTGQAWYPNVDIAQNSMFMGYESAQQKDIVMRCTGVAVPQGAQITEAYLTFRAAANDTTFVDVTIFAEDNMTPATFTGTYHDYITRDLTTNRVSWRALEDWTAGNDYDSPDISEIVQELVDNASWASGNDIAFFVRDNASEGHREARTFNGGGGPILTVEYVTGTETLGRDETCDEEVYVANKHNRGQITHIFREDGGVFSANLLGGGVPYTLFPNPTANGDILWIGSDTSTPYGGPFCSLVFDLANPVDVAPGLNFGTWEYPIAPLAVTDNTKEFTVGGVNSVSWEQPDDWAPSVVNGVTAYWVFFNVFSAWAVTVAQQNRDVYSALWGNVEIAADQVLGDLPALLRGILRNQSDKETDTPAAISTQVNLYADRVIMGLRSYDRGDDWQAYLNFSDIQNPATVNVETVGSYAAIVATQYEAPTGRAVVVTPPVGGLELQERVKMKLSPELTTKYYGTYHAFLRVAQIEDGGNPGDRGDFSVQVKVASGQPENVFFTSDLLTTQQIANAPSTYQPNVFEPLDLGEVQISPGPGVTQDTQGLFVNVWVSAVANATHGALVIYDIALMPIDEWAGDFSNSLNARGSQLSYGQLQRTLDVGSHNYKRAIQALLQNDNIVTNWLSVSNAKAILQGNAQQKLALFTMRHIRVTGTHDGGASPSVFSDSSEDFEDMGVRPGDTIYNLTDGSSATVTSVEGTNNREVHGVLSGGANNTWDTNYNALILIQDWTSPPYTLHTLRLFKQQVYEAMRGAR